MNVLEALAVARHIEQTIFHQTRWSMSLTQWMSLLYFPGPTFRDQCTLQCSLNEGRVSTCFVRNVGTNEEYLTQFTCHKLCSSPHICYSFGHLKVSSSFY